MQPGGVLCSGHNSAGSWQQRLAAALLDSTISSPFHADTINHRYKLQLQGQCLTRKRLVQFLVQNALPVPVPHTSGIFCSQTAS